MVRTLLRGRDLRRRWLRARSRAAGHRLPRFGRRMAPFSRVYGFDRGTPVDRFYIADFLARHSGLDAYGAGDVRGRVLEVGGDAYAREYGRAVERIDVLHATPDNPQATFVDDLEAGTHLPSETFDCVICTQTLHAIYDVPAAVATLHRILVPGGVALVTAPGITRAVTPDRDLWGDHWRFTTASLRRLFEEAFPGGEVKVLAYGNVLTATALLYGLAAEELAPAQLECHDPDYEVLLAVHARRARA